MVILSGDKACCKVPCTAVVAEVYDKEIQQSPGQRALPAAFVKDCDTARRQGGEHGGQGQAVFAKVIQHSEEQQQPGQKVDAKLHKVCEQVCNQAADGYIDHGRKAADDDAHPNRETGKAVQQNAEGRPFRTHVQQLYDHARGRDDQLRGAVIAHF